MKPPAPPKFSPAFGHIRRNGPERLRRFFALPDREMFTFWARLAELTELDRASVRCTRDDARAMNRTNPCMTS